MVLPMLDTTTESLRLVTAMSAAGYFGYYQVANDLNRFVGDRDPLAYHPDGSVDIYMQHANPGPSREANWLAAPAGPISVRMRIYAPRPEGTRRHGTPPPVRKA
jgi:hypothetical protein